MSSSSSTTESGSGSESCSSTDSYCSDHTASTVVVDSNHATTSADVVKTDVSVHDDKSPRAPPPLMPLRASLFLQLSSATTAMADDDVDDNHDHDHHQLRRQIYLSETLMSSATRYPESQQVVTTIHRPVTRQLPRFWHACTGPGTKCIGCKLSSELTTQNKHAMPNL